MTFDDAVRATHAAFDWRAVPYFRALDDGTFAREDFVETQIQFFAAVVFFVRPMTVLAARLPEARLRGAILGNVLEEHGRGEAPGTHESTFLALLARLGVSREDVDARAQWPEVRAFDDAVAGACAVEDPAFAMAALGMIEDQFAGISAFLGDRIARAGWVPREHVVHYATHEVLDVRHAEEFYDVVRPLWDRPHARYQITQGLAFGAYVFTRLYRDLYEARARRTFRDVRGPHVRGGGSFDP